MQSVSSKIWTRVAVSISCDDNHYTTGTSITYDFRVKGATLNSVSYCQLKMKSSFYLLKDLHVFNYEFKYVFTNPSAPAGCGTRAIFLTEFNKFEYSVFLQLEWLPNQE